LAIVVDELSRQERCLHFLPFASSKRDERFAEEDSNKIAPAFTHSALPADPEKEFQILREYLTQFAAKKKATQLEKPQLAKAKSSQPALEN
jgi:hypothetical protein